MRIFNNFLAICNLSGFTYVYMNALVSKSAMANFFFLHFFIKFNYYGKTVFG